MSVSEFSLRDRHFQEDDMDNNTTSLQKHRIPSDKRRECLELFEQGYGYKKAARLAGLNVYTVREYKRRFASGDNTWVDRGGSSASI